MPNDTAAPFDRAAYRAHRARAARHWGAQNFLVREVAERLVQRLDDIKREFPMALDLGCRGGEVSRAVAGRGGIRQLFATDTAFEFARPARGVVAEEETLPFADASLDLVISVLNLHWVNDLPGALLQIRRALKPDGLLLAAMLGGGTLAELRAALLQAEAEIENGASPRVSPFAELRDAAGLLQRAGFALPVADTDRISVSYKDALSLMHELRAMGESNAVRERRRHFTRRATLLRAAEIYGQRHGDKNGRIAATFQVIYLHAWAPHPAQPQPLKPGAAQNRLADALGTVERPAGEKAGR